MMLDPFFLEHGVLLGGRYGDLIYAFVAAEGNLGLVKHIVEILLANLFFVSNSVIVICMIFWFI
jgi:hypothetical protein